MYIIYYIYGFPASISTNSIGPIPKKTYLLINDTIMKFNRELIVRREIEKISSLGTRIQINLLN